MNYEQLQLKEYLSILGIALGGNSVQSKITNYAKQTQFAECSNERKLSFNKGLLK